MANYTFQEIDSQPEVWKQALDVIASHTAQIKHFWQTGNYDSLLFVGCGSTYHLATAAAAAAQLKLGILARAIPGSALLVYPDTVLEEGRRPLLVTISRSGTTTETIQAAQIFRQRYGDHVLCISCYSDRPLNAEAQLTLANPAAQEYSLAQTRSFTSMLLLAEGLIAALADDALDETWIGQDVVQLVTQAYDTAEQLADPARFDQYYFLGSGPYYGLACEAMVKMTEMSQTIVHALPTLEIRHGPMSMVDDRTMVVGLLNGHDNDYEQAVLADMRQLGATTVSISPAADADFVLPAGQSLVRYMPLLQYMAYHRSLKKNLQPDQPRNLVMSIEL